MLELVRDGKFSFPPRTWKKVSPTGFDIVKRLMRVNPEVRLNGEEMKNHPDFVSIVQKPNHKSFDLITTHMFNLLSTTVNCTA